MIDGLISDRLSKPFSFPLSEFFPLFFFRDCRGTLALFFISEFITMPSTLLLADDADRVPVFLLFRALH